MQLRKEQQGEFRFWKKNKRHGTCKRHMVGVKGRKKKTW
nr:MAG TPA: hypothetical protein [Caudoviricetes sp.]